MLAFSQKISIINRLFLSVSCVKPYDSQSFVKKMTVSCTLLYLEYLGQLNEEKYNWTVLLNVQICKSHP